MFYETAEYIVNGIIAEEQKRLDHVRVNYDYDELTAPHIQKIEALRAVLARAQAYEEMKVMP